MKVDMSPKAIENRLKLVGELTKACLLLRRNIIEGVDRKTEKKNIKSDSSLQIPKKN